MRICIHKYINTYTQTRIHKMYTYNYIHVHAYDSVHAHKQTAKSGCIRLKKTK